MGKEELILKDGEATPRHRKGRDYSRVRKADEWSDSLLNPAVCSLDIYR